jgi:hypothetical protein
MKGNPWGIAVVLAAVAIGATACGGGSASSSAADPTSYVADGSGGGFGGGTDGGGGVAPAPDVYVPAAFGENGQCYYVDDPSEATALVAEGSCPSDWTPAPMPVVWHQRYFPYYSSNAYILAYVLASHRSAYISSESRFGTTYQAGIAAAVKSAVYRGSSGQQVTGDKVDVSRFSSTSGLSSSRAVTGGSSTGGSSTGGSSGDTHSVTGGTTGEVHSVTGGTTGEVHSVTGGTTGGSHSSTGGSSGGRHK